MTIGHRPRVVAYHRSARGQFGTDLAEYSAGCPTAPVRSVPGPADPRLGNVDSATGAMAAAVARARCLSRAALPTPARTCSSLPRRTRACQGRAGARPWRADPCRRGPGAAERPQVRRAGDAAGLAIHSRGRRRHTDVVAAPRAACAARVSMWRLRRSEYRGDRVGDSSMGNRSTRPTIPTDAATAGSRLPDRGSHPADRRHRATAPTGHPCAGYFTQPASVSKPMYDVVSTVVRTTVVQATQKGADGFGRLFRTVRQIAATARCPGACCALEDVDGARATCHCADPGYTGVVDALTHATVARLSAGRRPCRSDRALRADPGSSPARP